MSGLPRYVPLVILPDHIRYLRFQRILDGNTGHPVGTVQRHRLMSEWSEPRPGIRCDRTTGRFYSFTNPTGTEREREWRAATRDGRNRRVFIVKCNTALNRSSTLLYDQERRWYDLGEAASDATDSMSELGTLMERADRQARLAYAVAIAALVVAIVLFVCVVVL